MNASRILRTSLVASALGASLAARAEVVFDQFGPNNGSAITRVSYSSQRFEPGNTAYVAVALDDFEIDVTYRLTRLDFALVLYDPSASVSAISGYHVSVYGLHGGAPVVTEDGDVANLDLSPSQATTHALFGLTTAYRVSLDLSVGGISLAPGSYYIGVQPINDFGVNGQTAILGSTLDDGSADAFQVNANGGFGFPGDEADLAGVHLGYRLEGSVQAVPEPASLAALALGAVASYDGARGREGQAYPSGGSPLEPHPLADVASE